MEFVVCGVHIRRLRRMVKEAKPAISQLLEILRIETDAVVIQLTIMLSIREVMGSQLKALLNKPTGTQLLKKLIAFCETRKLVPLSQEPATGPYEHSPYPHIL